MQTETKNSNKNRVGEVHHFALRFANGSTVSVSLTIPPDGEATDYLMQWFGTLGRGDRKAYTAWRASICETLRGLTGRE